MTNLVETDCFVLGKNIFPYIRGQTDSLCFVLAGGSFTISPLLIVLVVSREGTFFFQLEIRLFFSQVDSVALQLMRLQRRNRVPERWHLHALL